MRSDTIGKGELEFLSNGGWVGWLAKEEEKEEEEVEWRTGKPPRIVSADDDVRNWSNDGWMDD